MIGDADVNGSPQRKPKFKKIDRIFFKKLISASLR
jgi:hypothetical protein